MTAKNNKFESFNRVKSSPVQMKMMISVHDKGAGGTIAHLNAHDDRAQQRRRTINYFALSWPSYNLGCTRSTAYLIWPAASVMPAGEWGRKIVEARLLVPTSLSISKYCMHRRATKAAKLWLQLEQEMHSVRIMWSLLRAKFLLITTQFENETNTREQQYKQRFGYLETLHTKDAHSSWMQSQQSRPDQMTQEAQGWQDGAMFFWVWII
eukprot:scaffold50706_cov17-Tisochrysis_lutea.AAC.1